MVIGDIGVVAFGGRWRVYHSDILWIPGLEIGYLTKGDLMIIINIVDGKAKVLSAKMIGWIYLSILSSKVE